MTIVDKKQTRWMVPSCLELLPRVEAMPRVWLGQVYNLLCPLESDTRPSVTTLPFLVFDAQKVAESILIK